MLKICILTAKR
ncbi:Protein CBG25919 [Caenorhabditis briggsae]|uniref:Protein CBG25919 n=1 Tax=Caenorhabditis briggsae TaxID=6238 RepID=B6IK51_CAEBR|nr:Protein CBG25919 [Caenorhabditis briggsae]CAS00281.1 Protein CBG25919 [Caenorhabditis briggsae]